MTTNDINVIRLDLTADEVRALKEAAAAESARSLADPVLLSALRKLTTSIEEKSWATTAQPERSGR